MAIITKHDGDTTVATIAVRNAIPKKFDGMQVMVLDASGDASLGAGQALYQYSSALSSWVLLWASALELTELDSRLSALVQAIGADIKSLFTGKADTAHTHSAATTSVDGFMSAEDKTKLNGIATSANNYTHPTGDGNLHVPATGTTNKGKVLTAGETAGSLSWTAIPSAPVSSVAGKTGAVTLVKGDVGLSNVDNTADSAKNVLSATKLATARTIALSGDVTGSVNFDGSADIAITATVVDDSHNHVMANVDGLQTALDAKLPSSSYTAADVLTKIKTVDGSGSGLDADTLDGLQASAFATATQGAKADLAAKRYSANFFKLNPLA